jgi:hypothetical protein
MWARFDENGKDRCRTEDDRWRNQWKCQKTADEEKKMLAMLTRLAKKKVTIEENFLQILLTVVHRIACTPTNLNK